MTYINEQNHLVQFYSNKKKYSPLKDLLKGAIHNFVLILYKNVQLNT